MGTYIHTSLMAYGYELSDLQEAHRVALRLVFQEEFDLWGDAAGRESFRGKVTPISEVANSLCVFYIVPSGGKMGGQIETMAQRTREEWKRLVKNAGLRVDWVETVFGETETRVSDSRSRDE